MTVHEVITRRRLPHWYVPGASFFVTFRLADSLPRVVLESLATKRELLLRQRPPSGMSEQANRDRIHKLLFAEYDRHLDQGSDVAWLKQPEVAEVVRNSLYHFHGERYHLMSYCIMPNHVHVLFAPKTTGATASETEFPTLGERADRHSPLASILHSWKSFTAHEINKVLGRSGTLWQPESYDHWARDEDELERIVDYIAANPTKANLAARPTDFRFSSAYDRYCRDGETSGWLPE
jgi:REP element-mobilizing transposase RayT